MGFIKSIFFMFFILNEWKCEEAVFPSLVKILSLSDSFNVSAFDHFYGDIKFNKKYWKENLGNTNVTTECDKIQNIVNGTSTAVINIKNNSERIRFTNYVLAKLLKAPCQPVVPPPERRSSFKIWIIGFLTVTVNNLLAVLGVFFIPIIKRKIYNTVMTFMVALAIGALAGTSILILIPDSMQVAELLVKLNHNKNDYKWKSTVVFVGLYMFFITERLLKIFTKMKSREKGTSDTFMKFEISKMSNDEVMETLSQNEKNKINQREEANKGERKIDIESNIEPKIENIAPVAWMIVLGDALHNFVDGLSIGAAFSQSIVMGISVSLAVLCEELPHELGDFAVLLTSGMTVKQAVFWNLMSAMTCYLGFICGAIAGEVGEASYWIFALAGGMFLYISLVDMMNNIIETIDDMVAPWRQKVVIFTIQNCGLWTGYFTILVLALYGDRISINF